MNNTHLPPRLVLFSIRHYRLVILFVLVVTILFALAIPRIRVDTDPENMLSEDEDVRVFHREMKKAFNLNDIVVLGVVNERHPDGVFNPESLRTIYELTEFVKTLQWEEEGETAGVVLQDLLAPSTVDNIEQGGPGTVRFEWLMHRPPETREEALAIRDNARDNPLLYGTLLSENGKALCLYIPITSKDLSYRIARELEEKTAAFQGEEEFHITGLPVAEDTFGVEMFKQMAISAPLAMVIIFILMFLFFRKIFLILSPLILAFISVIWTMGLLIALGFPVHIMSSMIPIFIMPIAVLDSVHIKSEFFDRYQSIRDKRKTMEHVMHELFTPMLYTSLTTMAGFSSLALTPIPPVQIFGLFVAFGVGTAWILTVTFVPAFTMLIREESLKNFGLKTDRGEKEGTTLVSRFMHSLGRFSFRAAPGILIVTALVAALAIWGITKIQVNDNPVKWFTRHHPIRVADEVLNRHFGGTYMAYLVLEPGKTDAPSPDEAAATIRKRLSDLEGDLKGDYPDSGIQLKKAGKIVSDALSSAGSAGELLESVNDAILQRYDEADGDAIFVWDEILSAVETIPLSEDPFKRPDVLRYIATLQEALSSTEVVGKSNSVTDVVKKVYKELMEGNREYYRVPDTAAGVAQCLISFQNSHKPNDLWHLVTPDYGKANIWVQLKSGDNRDMSRVVREVDAFFKKNDPPIPLKHNWFGLTYINVIWQEKMVGGMLRSFLGSFLIVFVMMLILYRSVWWGAIAMIPMTVTVGVIYGIIGFVGKDYDMPVAVLSSLTLGLAVDFGIHFLTRSRVSVERSKTGTWEEARDSMFGEPARAITRNIIVIAVGFLPLLAAPLIPYKTVGIFLSAILALSGVATLVILPALVQVLRKRLFITRKEPVSRACNCGLCAAGSLAAAVLIALNLHQYFHMRATTLAVIGIILIPVFGLICGMLSRRRVCRTQEKETEHGG